MQLLVLITLPARTLKDCGNVGEVSADVVQLSRRSMYQGALLQINLNVLLLRIMMLKQHYF